MVSVSNNIIGNSAVRILCAFSIVVLLLTSCVTGVQEVARPQPELVTFEPRHNLLRWYEPVFKTYYGLKGPVRTLLINPIKAIGGNADDANFGWQLEFDRDGWLLRKKRLGGDPEFETIYEYRSPGMLKQVVSMREGRYWRTSDYIYNGDKLIQVVLIDHTNHKRSAVRFARQETSNGWFEIQTPVEEVDLPAYWEFLHGGTLEWHSKGDINNGLSELYYLRTVDGVTSSNVSAKGTMQMSGVGGYRYTHNKAGLLESVASYNAHNNHLFHVTHYQYDNLQLLISETRTVKDESPFNQAIDESVGYHYKAVDGYANWHVRELKYVSKYISKTYMETREISYYKN